MRRATAITIVAAVAWFAVACGSETRTGEPRRDCRTPVYFEPDGEVEGPRVVGTFNDWTPSKATLTDENGDGVYGTWIRTGPGLHRYRIRTADGREHLDAYNPLKMVDETGQMASAVYGGDCSVPKVEAVSVESDGDGFRATFRFLRSTDGPGLDANAVVGTLDGEKKLDVEVDGIRMELSADGLAPGKYHVTVEAKDRGGVAAEPASFPVWIEENTFTWNDALIYQVFIDRFASGRSELSDDEGPLSYHGGDLNGVVEKLESGYFEKLGINVLWLSPVYENPDGWFDTRIGRPSEAYHGYWPSDPRGVEERFGGAEALDRLVEKAHDRGIRVMLDIVLNHVHRDHPYFQNHETEAWFNRPKGDCICGVTCSWGAHMRSCWFEEFVADLDWSRPEVADRVLEDTLWWVDRFDVDGFRLDAVPMMPRYAIRHLRARLDRKWAGEAPHFYLLGENYVARGKQPVLAYFLGPHTLSGEFRFPVMWTLRDAMAGDAPMSALDRSIKRGRRLWQGSGAVMAPFLGNHDVQRFVTAMRKRRPNASDRAVFDRLELAWTFVLTQPGAPVIYYGDEIAMAGGPDPRNRRDMRFGGELSSAESGILKHVRRLGRLRRCSRALRRGDYVTVDQGKDHFVYARRAETGEVALVALNRSDASKKVRLKPPSAEIAHALADAGTPVEPDASGKITFEIPPLGASLLLTEVDCVR